MWIPKVQRLLEGGTYLSLSALRGNTVIISVCINHISPSFFTSFYHAKKHIIKTININVVGKNA